MSPHFTKVKTTRPRGIDNTILVFQFHVPVYSPLESY